MAERFPTQELHDEISDSPRVTQRRQKSRRAGLPPEAVILANHDAQDYQTGYGYSQSYSYNSGYGRCYSSYNYRTSYQRSYRYWR
jgi:hypothetical protein